MNNHTQRKIFLLGLASSLAAFFFALGSLPFATPTSLASHDEQLALLYKVSPRDIPRLAMGTSSRAIYVDLAEMQVTLIDNGTELRKIPVLSKGKPGSFWETPTGNYRVETKEATHFSSIGNVWMPYSMQFFGNYFIHGWPHYDDGTPVKVGYSGGCIRLSTEDAAQVYAFAELGTPIYIRGAKDLSTNQKNTFRYFLNNEGRLDEITARSFLVADLESGQVLWERNGGDVRSLGGLSALMSSVIALETVNQYKNVRMSELLLGKAIPRIDTEEHEDELPIGALIYPLMFESNDTAARAFASDHGERAFVRKMNEKAEALGMTNAHYASSTASVSNVGSVNDLFVLLRNIYEQKNFLIGATLKEEHVIHNKDGEAVRFRWENQLMKTASSTEYRGGMMTKKGELGEAALIYSLPLEEFGNRTVAFVALESADPYQDIEKMRRFVSDHFVYAPDVSGLSTVVVEEHDPIPSLWGRIRSLWITSWLMNRG